MEKYKKNCALSFSLTSCVKRDFMMDKKEEKRKKIAKGKWGEGMKKKKIICRTDSSLLRPRNWKKWEINSKNIITKVKNGETKKGWTNGKRMPRHCHYYA